MQTMSDIHQLAAEAYACFETAERPNGQTFTRTKDGTPEWVGELVRAAHGDDFLPDDWRYETIRSALAFIADDATDPEDDAHTFADTQVDVYTSNLLAWLSSNLRRLSYVDDAVSEYGGEPGGIADQIMLGQYAEAREVYELTVSALRDLAD